MLNVFFTFGSAKTCVGDAHIGTVELPLTPFECEWMHNYTPCTSMIVLPSVVCCCPTWQLTVWFSLSVTFIFAFNFLTLFTPEPPNLAAAAEFGPLAENQPKKNSARLTMAFPRCCRKKSRPSSLMPFWWPLPHKIIVLYSVDLTNNLKQPHVFVTQIAFLHISSGLLCAMHYFYGRPIE